MREHKKILFVVNTMGRAGAEMALAELLRQIESSEYEIFLYVLMGQGEMLKELPPGVRLLNRHVSSLSVLNRKGRCRMAGTVVLSFFRNGGLKQKLSDIAWSLTDMIKYRNFQISKLFWRTVSEGARRFEITFDLAVAWLEGGSAYYVAEHVNAQKKAAFIHTDYGKSGYTRKMDRACWRHYEKIYAVSRDAKLRFREFYPEYREKVDIFYNSINQETIRRRAREQGGFSDAYEGVRLLTVGRLTWQKGYDIAVEAMKLLKARGYRVRWYILGEGDQRRSLEKKIERLGLKDDFLLLGAVENPYPYYAQTDIYVHMTRVEGKSVAVSEAQTLGCAVLASDCGGNKEQIKDGLDGILCTPKPHMVADNIIKLMNDNEFRMELGRQAAAKKEPQGQAEKLFRLLA